MKLIRKKYKKYYKNIRSIEIDSKINIGESTINPLQQNITEKKAIKSEL